MTLSEIEREVSRFRDRLNLGVQPHEIHQINNRLDDMERAVGEIRAEIDGALSRLQALEDKEKPSYTKETRESL